MAKSVYSWRNIHYCALQHLCWKILGHIFLRLLLGKQHREIIYRRQADPWAVHCTVKMTSKSAAYLPGASYFAVKYYLFLLLHVSLCVPFACLGKRKKKKKKFSQTSLMMCLHVMTFQHNSSAFSQQHFAFRWTLSPSIFLCTKMPMGFETHTIRTCCRCKQNQRPAMFPVTLNLKFN